MSLDGYDLRSPRVDLKIIHGPQGLTSGDLKSRIVRFEYGDEGAKKLPYIQMVLDNSDGKALNMAIPAIGLIFEVSWGYGKPHTKVFKVTVNRVQGNMVRGGNSTSPAPNAYGEVTYECGLHNIIQKTHWDPDFRLQDVGSELPQTPSRIVYNIARQMGYGDKGIKIQYTDMLGRPQQELSEITIDSRETAEQFIDRWARLLGFDYDTSREKFSFHHRDFEPQISDVISYFKGPDLLDFSIDGDYRAFVTRVRSKSIDPGSGYVSILSDDLSTVLGGLNLVPYRGSIPEGTKRTDTIQTISKKAALSRIKQLAEHARKRWKIDMKLVGNPAIFRRSQVRLDNFGPYIDGYWVVKSVKHTIDTSGYTTDLSLRGRYKGGGVGVVCSTLDDTGTMVTGGIRVAGSNYSTFGRAAWQRVVHGGSPGQHNTGDLE